MKISRRSFLTGAFATTVYISLWSVDTAKAKINAGSKPEEKKIINENGKNIISSW